MTDRRHVYLTSLKAMSVILRYTEVSQQVSPDSIIYSSPLQSNYVHLTLKMQDINFVAVNSPSATDTKDGSACESPYSQSVFTLSFAASGAHGM